MGRYIANRLLIALPVLVVVTIVAFFLSVNAPGDKVLELTSQQTGMTFQNAGYTLQTREYRRSAERIGADKPQFYFAVVPSNWPDTLYRIIQKSERNTARFLLAKHGDWATVENYMRDLRTLAARNAESNAAKAAVNSARYLLITTDPERIGVWWKRMSAAGEDPEVRAQVQNVMHSRQQMENSRKRGYLVPKVIWYGPDNQYHNWLSGLFRGDFGVSVIDGRPVARKVREAVAWTLRINLTAILLAFLIAIPLGLYSGRMAGSRVDRLISNSLFIFFAIPSFWLATLLIVFFTTPEYAVWMDLFPSGGLGRYYDATGMRRIAIMAGALFLPVLSLLLGALAYLTRQMRDNVVLEASKPYVRMAKAKGLSDRQVYRRHILKNALFPILTLLGAAIPASISGSVIIEVLFNIPGMGRLLYQSILAQDWQVVFAMVVLASLLTVVGYLVSDLLYRLFDPRLVSQRQLV